MRNGDDDSHPIHGRIGCLVHLIGSATWFYGFYYLYPHGPLVLTLWALLGGVAIYLVVFLVMLLVIGLISGIAVLCSGRSSDD